MIKGVLTEQLIRMFAVEGEGPVDRPHSATRIVVDRVEITYERTTERGWTPKKIHIKGWRAKADGTAGGQFLEEHWYYNPSPDPAVMGSWGYAMPPALWLTVLAANTCPDGPALEPVPGSGEAAVDLDAVEG
jgi:hypothetical protein